MRAMAGAVRRRPRPRTARGASPGTQRSCSRRTKPSRARPAASDEMSRDPSEGMIDVPVRRLPWPGAQASDVEPLVTGEWLLANGLAGCAGGSIAGGITRRYHGLLVAALGTGRTIMFTHVWERLRLPDRSVVVLSDEENASGPLLLQGARYLTEFRLELGLPVWRYDINGFILEKRIVLVHRQNTVHVSYRLLTGEGRVRLTLRPSVHFRDHHAPVDAPVPGPFPLTAVEDRLEIGAGPELPPLRLRLHGVPSAFVLDGKVTRHVLYRI